MVLVDDVGDSETTRELVVEHPDTHDISRGQSRRTDLYSSEHLRGDGDAVPVAQFLEVRLGGGSYEDLPGHADRRPR